MDDWATSFLFGGRCTSDADARASCTSGPRSISRGVPAVGALRAYCAPPAADAAGVCTSSSSTSNTSVEFGGWGAAVGAVSQEGGMIRRTPPAFMPTRPGPPGDDRPKPSVNAKGSHRPRSRTHPFCWLRRVIEPPGVVHGQRVADGGFRTVEPQVDLAEGDAVGGREGDPLHPATS